MFQDINEETIFLLKVGFERSPNSQVLAEYRNGDVHILKVNKAFTEFYGYSQEEVLDGNPRILNSNKQDPHFFITMWDAILDPKIGFWRDEIINKRKDGSLINVILTINTIFDEDNSPKYFTAYHVDITKRKIAEEKLRKSEEKYHLAYEQADLYKDIVAHDINNVLQVIKSSLELSSLYFNSPEKLSKIKELYEIMEEQVIRGSNIISNVVKLSELDKEQILSEKVESINFLKRSITYIKESYPSREIKIQTNFYKESVYVLANNLLLDVFENLLINSIRHNDNLTIELFVKVSPIVKEGKNYILFEISDNGRGINDERKPIIFEHRKNLRTKTMGMGLGLSLVKKIINSYNGSIWVEDRVKGDYQKGSSFKFLIPEA